MTAVDVLMPVVVGAALAAFLILLAVASSAHGHD
jgi:hypothetical protein